MELAIKKNIKKLPEFIPDIEVIATQITNNGFELLRLKDEHIFSYQDLPLFGEHKDPFDRFLIAVARHEDFVVISTDAKFQLYSSLIKIL
jgi:PIN domain nuclease of toxin-antitoxin system